MASSDGGGPLPDEARGAPLPGFPPISIVTPSYNDAAHLEETMLSVLEHGYPSTEYIVVDGGSTDGSMEVIERHARRVAHRLAEPGGGRYRALTAGFARSSGEVMGWLDPGDVLLPGALHLVAEVFLAFPDVSWLCGSAVALREDGVPADVERVPRWSRWHLLSGRGTPNLRSGATFWRRTLWEAAGGRFDHRVEAADVDLWARFSRHARPAVLDAPLAAARHRVGHEERDAPEVSEIRAREVARSPVDRRAAQLAGAALAAARGGALREVVDTALGGSSRIVYQPREGRLVKREGPTLGTVAAAAFRVATGQEPRTPEHLRGVVIENANLLGRAVTAKLRAREERILGPLRDRAVAARRDYPAGFHGDEVYRQLIDELIRTIPVGAFVETGTYLGDSAGFVATRHPGLPVHTVDVNPAFLERAARRLRGLDNVRLYRGSSDRLVRHLIQGPHPPKVPLFFLDAHWYARWPLEDELDAIAGCGPAVIVVDDFEVPGRPEFGHDAWEVNSPEGRRWVGCDLSLVAGHLRRGRDYRLLIPDYRAEDAFPWGREPTLRGHLVVFQDLQEAFAGLTGGSGVVASRYREVQPPAPTPGATRRRPRDGSAVAEWTPRGRRASRPAAPWLRDPWASQGLLLRGVRRPVVFDVGAHVGGTLRRYLEHFPDAEIHCFEPSPGSFRELERAARGRPLVHVHRVALSDHLGEAPLHSSQRFPATSSLLPPARGRRYRPRGAEVGSQVTVPLETVDHFCSERGIDRVDVLKIDVQGGELAVLRGAEGLLRRGAIQLVYTEVLFIPHYEGAALFSELAQTLQEHGYSLYNLYDLRSAANGQLSFGDALFVSPGLRERVVDAFPPEP